VTLNCEFVLESCTETEVTPIPTHRISFISIPTRPHRGYFTSQLRFHFRGILHGPIIRESPSFQFPCSSLVCTHLGLEKKTENLWLLHFQRGTSIATSVRHLAGGFGSLVVSSWWQLPFQQQFLAAPYSQHVVSTATRLPCWRLLPDHQVAVASGKLVRCQFRCQTELFSMRIRTWSTDLFG